MKIPRLTRLLAVAAVLVLGVVGLSATTLVACGESGTSPEEIDNDTSANDGNDGNGNDNQGNGGNDNSGTNGENDGEQNNCEKPHTVIPQPVADPEDDPCRPNDGWNSAAIFVATHGDDSNDGSLSAPLQTIQAGLDKAFDVGIAYVLVESGTYPEVVELREGIQLIAAYEVGWAFHRTNRARIEGGNPTLIADQIEEPTRIVNLRADAIEEVDDGASVVTAYFRQSDGIILENVQIYGGRAGDGINGEEGDDGDDGDRGGPGKTASRTGGWDVCNFDEPGDVGEGATNICPGTSGGDGGEGGRGSDSGKPGHPAEGGASGGEPGEEEQNGQPGEDGEDGEDGEHGSGGSADGYFDGLQWVGEDGTDGTDGTAGTGGGGGGGAGGEDTTLTCDHWGGSGGGGGSGGCGGTGGTAGTHGGASVALFLEDSDIELRQARIEGGTGGDGGHGGPRGEKGNGRAGGEGGPSSGDGGAGGDGGRGGDGGYGGHGGGGAGGPAFAIFSTAELTGDFEDSRIDEGNPGRGGGPVGEPTEGAEGLSADIQIAW